MPHLRPPPLHSSQAMITVLVHNEDIEIPPDRFRKEFKQDKLDELRRSILETGLIHPITVEPNGTGDSWILRAGERRLRVIRSLIADGLPFRCGSEQVTGGLVPVIEWDKLTERERLELEVAENVDRTDFAWQERVDAIAARHRLRQMDNPKQTVTATASEIQGRPAQGDEITEVSRALLIHKHFDQPGVATARNEKEALKAIQKNAQAVHQAKLAEKFDLKKTPHTLIRGDACAVLPTLPAGSFDVVLTDPPYGIDADDFGTQSATGHDYKDSRKRWESIMSVFPDESYRVTKARAHAYVFCDPRLFARLETLMCLAGWKVFSTPLVWVKGNGMLPFPKHGPRRTYECILYAWKGDREVVVVKNDTIVKIPGIKELKQAAQKPVALYCDLLSRSVNPGDRVLDCFGGSGPILVAANRMRLVATYIEEKEVPYNIAVARSTVKDIDDGAEEDDGISITVE